MSALERRMGIFDRILPKKQPEIPYIAFEEEKKEKGNLEKFSKKLLNKSLILLIIGKRGAGKTALGMRLLEMFHKKTKKKTYIRGYKKAKLPLWIKKIENIEDVHQNSTILIDEGAITFSSRESMKESNKMLSKIMAVSRHKNLSLILIVQNSGMIDLNVLRLVDTIVLKEPSLMQSKFERKALKDIYEKVQPHFDRLKDREKYVFIMDDEFEGMLKYGLPDFWTEKISKSMKDF